MVLFFNKNYDKIKIIFAAQKSVVAVKTASTPLRLQDFIVTKF